MEAAAQRDDRGEPVGHQRDPAGFRRPAARREQPADPGRSAVEAAMRCAGLSALLLAVAAGAALAQALVPEPDGYRTQDYRAPTPATLRGARTVTTAQAHAMWKAGDVVFVDVLPHPPRPPKLPAGTIWRDRERPAILGNRWLREPRSARPAPAAGA